MGKIQLVHGTPVERVSGIWVKREDLCCPEPGPPFSKMRGVFSHIQNRPEQIIGVLDTYHSMAGWGVAFTCRSLGKKCVNFWPRYKAEEEGVLREFQKRSGSLGAGLVDFPAGRSAILYHRARAWLKDNMPQAYLMPNALKLGETVAETAREVVTCELPRSATQDDALWVVSISSGTIAAGVMVGLQDRGIHPRVILHLGYSRSEKAVRAYMEKCGVTIEFECVDEGYSYRDAVTGDTPFPCNSHYDLKAWNWLQSMRTHLPGSVLFWNIGA